MEKQLITYLLQSQKIQPSKDFKPEEYEIKDGGVSFLSFKDSQNGIYYATKGYHAEIFRALYFYVNSKVEYFGYEYDQLLSNRLFFEPPVYDRHISFLCDELENLRSRVEELSYMRFSFDLKGAAMDTIDSFLSKNFESWLIYWHELGYIDFEKFNRVDTSEFDNALTVLKYLECVQNVKDRIKMLINGGEGEKQLPVNNTINETDEPIADDKVTGGEPIYQGESKKLVWRGTPAHFAFIIDLLIEKGYLQKPTPFGERTAEMLLSIFDFVDHKPTKESLGKLLHKDRYPISDQAVIDRFRRIPGRDELKR